MVSTEIRLIFILPLLICELEKAMASYSSTLAWKIPLTEELSHYGLNWHLPESCDLSICSCAICHPCISLVKCLLDYSQFFLTGFKNVCTDLAALGPSFGTWNVAGARPLASCGVQAQELSGTGLGAPQHVES